MKLIESFGTLKLNGLTSNDIQDIMQTVVNTAKLQLQQFAQTADFSDKMIQTFGTSPAGLQSAWANGIVILPSIDIVSSSEIDGANGAFAAATDRIYIAAEFLTANINNIKAIAKLVLEEYGHKLDTIINNIDTKGDEGAKFAAFVTGENLSPSQLAQLDNENDIAEVNLGGQVVEIEKADTPLSNQIITVQPTDNEQYMLTLVNRMRMNPAAEYSLLTNSLDADINRAIDFFNVDLNLLQDQWNNLIPTNPLAWSEQLNQAAQGHNELMISFDQQSHQLPGEPPLGERVTNAGYQFTNVAESIFAFSESVFYGHAGFAIDWGFDEGGIQNPPGHRENIMNANYREVGIDIIAENNPNTSVGPLVITQNFGNRNEIDNQAWLLGTVFQDLNEDTFYSIGEGLNNIVISITGLQETTFNNTIDTWEAGGYQILLNPGNYQVDFLQNGRIFTSETVEIGTNNVLLDAIFTEEVIVNNNPVATNDTATTQEGNAVTINVLENDIDVENNIDVTTVAIGTQPTNGTVNVNATTGEITYTPTGDFTGEDSFTYTVQDADGGTSNVGTVNVTVTPVNDNPVANNDSAITSEDRSVIIKVLNNDSDIDGNLDLSTLQIVGQPNNGTIRYISSTGEIVYTPNRNFFGEDNFTYTIQDTNGGTSNVARVNLTVNSVNDVPVAVDDNNTQPEDTAKVPFIINEDTSFTVNVLANDVDIENGIDPQTVTIVDRPLNGRVTINRSTGEITYTPDDNFFGNDSFTYTVQDRNRGTSNTATVDIRVNSVNDNPTANNDTATTEIGKSVIIKVLNNDSDIELGNLTVSVRNTNSANARLYVNPLTGEITYTPENNFIGNDSFEYTITDANGGTSTARVNVSVTPEDIINPTPIDNNNFTTREDNSVVIHLLDNEENADNITDNSIITVVNGPNNGTVRIDQITKEITYTPNSNFAGRDSFTYSIFGGSRLINENINITVQPINDVPVAVNDNVRTDENESVNINVLGNDIEVEDDLNGSNITILSEVINGVEREARNGTVRVNSNGTITYTPNNNFFGVDSFSYTIEDEKGAVSNVARVEVIVNPINDIPVAVDDSGTTEQGSSLVINVLNNDIDVEGEIDINTLQIGTQPRNGTLQIISTTGEIIYTPTGNFIGEDSFTYTVKEINDGNETNEIANGETSNVATVRINVTPINVPPVANNDLVTTQEDTTVVINVLGNDVDTNFDLSSVQIGSNPNHGTVTVNTTTGTISYRPNDNFAGEDSFTYTVRDTNGVVSNVANVNVTVNPVNDIPVANNDAVVTQQDENITINVLNNDSDVENGIDVTTVQIVSNPNRGTVTINQTTGVVTYDPDSGFFGNDSFTYTVKDTGGATSNVGRVNVFVNPSDENNTPPVANNDSVTTVQNSALVIDVLGNDEDAEENIDVTTVEVDSNPENGRVSVNETTGEITYLPNNNFIGADSFTYRVKDRNGVNSNAATVNVIVNRFDPEPANFNAVQVLELQGNVEQTKQLKISFVSQNTSFINEIGVFRVDDAQGNINGVTPDDPEYLRTALENSQVVFSSLPNNVLGGVDFTRQINFNGSDRLVFYLVQNSTTQTVLSNIAAGRSPGNVLFALPNANSNNFDPVEISDLDQRTFRLSWKDSTSGNQTAFDDFVINVEILQTDVTPIGTGLQGEIELIDLRDLGTLTATFNIASEAAYNNTVGWYIVDDETGRIGGLRPGDRGYAQIAISQRTVTSFTREGRESAQLQGLLAPYLIADSSIEDFLEDNPLNVIGDGPLAYFAFSAANPDRVDHIVMLGDNTFGFEDLENGGDRDFNDIIMQVNFV